MTTWASAAFFSKVNFKSTLEWKEEIVYPDFRAASCAVPRTRAIVSRGSLGCSAAQAWARRKIRAANSPHG